MVLRFYMGIFHFFIISSFNHVTAQIMSKCCPLGDELHINSSDWNNIERENAFCRFTNGTSLVALKSLSLRIGLPNCSKMHTIDIYRRDVKVSCIDRISEVNDVYAVRCVQNETENSYNILNTMNMRKCCPSHRKYNWDKQYCWSKYEEDDENAASNLIKLAWDRKLQFINMSFGSPSCRKSDVLVDRIIRRNDVDFLNTDGISINDSNSTVILSFDEFCLDLVDDRFEFLVIRSCQDYITTCKHRHHTCVHKCCPLGYELFKEKCVLSFRPLSLEFYNVTQKHGVGIVASNIKPAFWQTKHCPGGKYKQIDDQMEKHILTMDGTLFIPATNHVIDINTYCIDNMKFHNESKMFVCVHDEKNVLMMIRELKPLLTSICTAISIFFFIMTFLIYLLLPSLRNLHGQLIMNYLIASALSYTMLLIHHLVNLRTYSSEVCEIMGYVTLLTTLSSFCWLNVISYDIWSTFRITRSTFLKKSKTCKKLILFNIYGWGFPLIWCLFAYGSKYISIINETPLWRCDIGVSSCWFTDYGKSKLIYFIVPISLMLIFNGVIFIIIVKYCSKVRAELHNTNNCSYSLRKYTMNKTNFQINVKLFILMGLNWSSEVIVSILQPKHRIFFIISDLLNALVGFTVFLILTMKRKVLLDLKKTFSRGNDKQSLDVFSRSDASTSSSILHSTTNSKKIKVNDRF